MSMNSNNKLNLIIFCVIVSFMVTIGSAADISETITATGRYEIAPKQITAEDEKAVKQRAAFLSKLYGDGWRARRKRLAAERQKLLQKRDGEVAAAYEKRIAVHNARLKALRLYVSALGKNDDTKSQYDIISTRQLLPIMLESIKVYVPEYRIIKEGMENGVFTTTIVAKIDSTEVNRLIKKATQIGANKTKDSNLVFVIVAREVSAIDEGHAVKTELEKKSASKSESVHVNEDAGEGSQKIESASKHKSTKYNTHVQERVAYRAFDIADVQSRILKNFSQADFEVLKVQDLLDAMDDDDGDDDKDADEEEIDALVKLSSAFAAKRGFSKRIKKLKKLSIEFECEWFAIAKMTVGRASVDADSGQVVVDVTLNMDVGRLVQKRLGKKIRRFYKNIASDIQSFKGYGQNPAAAKVNGLLRAGKAAAQGTIDQMRNKLGK